MKSFEQHVVKDRTHAANAAQTKADPAKQQLLTLLAPLRDAGQITISNAPHGVEIAINAKILFTSGDARLVPQSLDVLNQVALILRDHSTHNILVEGHTDSQPISNAKYTNRTGSCLRRVRVRWCVSLRTKASKRTGSLQLAARTISR